LNILFNNILILIFIFILFAYLLYKINNIKNSEQFANITDAAKLNIEIINQISTIYDADIQALRNLAIIAKQLNNGNNTTIPGTITISGQLTTDTAVINNLTVNGNINGLSLQTMNNLLNTLADTITSIKNVQAAQSSQQITNSQTSQIANSQAAQSQLITNSQASQVNNSQASLTANLQNNINLKAAQNSNLQNMLASNAVVVTSQGGQISGQASAISSQGGQISGQASAISSQGGQISGQASAITSQGAQISGQANNLTSQVAQISGQANTLTSQVAQISGQNNAILSQAAQLNNQNAAINSVNAMFAASMAQASTAQASLEQSILVNQINAVFNNYPLLNVIFNNAPWGMYSADNWSNNTLYDITSNKRNAATNGVVNLINQNGFGNGLNNTIPTLIGPTSSTITWPGGSIPGQFTIASTTRYNGGSRGRILNSKDGGNWLHGHWGNRSGVFHYDGWRSHTDVSQYASVINDDLNWLVCTGTNNTNIPVPYNILVTNNNSSNYTQIYKAGRDNNGGSGNFTLHINVNYEQSDYGLNNLLIWDKGLDITSMWNVQIALSQMLITGNTLFKLFSLLNNMTSSMFNKIINDTGYFINLYNTIKPWGIYSADNWSNNTLYDMTGNNRHASTSNVNYNADNLPCLTGGTNSTIIWPGGSIPSQYTIASITRYNGGSRGRILNSKDGGNWLHCHWGNRSGVCHYDGWRTHTDNSQSITCINDNLNWAVCVGTNNTNIPVPNNVIVNNTPAGRDSNGGSGNFTLHINVNYEQSDFAFSQLIIWDRPLTYAQMMIASITLNQMLTTRTTLKKILGK